MLDELSNFINPDDAIFHYTKKEIAMEYILNNKQLKFGFYHSTNDPHEYKQRLTSAFGCGDINESLYFESMHLIDNTIQNTSFLSFCDNSNNTGYKKPRMWSQYGQNQAGICLVFSKKLLIKTIKKELSKNYTIYNKKMNYKKIEIDPSTESESEYIQSFYKNIFFQKHIDYKDESEFRIVLVQKNEKNTYKDLFIDISNSLKLIILGDNFPKVYLPTIKNLSLELNVEHKKLLWEDNQYYQVNPLA